MKQDLEKDISKMDDKKAEKDVVELILKKIDQTNLNNKEDHRIILEKIDSLFNKIGEK